MDATDTAVKLAEKEGVNLEEVEGTGPDGRIYKGDVEDFIAARDTTPEPAPDADEGEDAADASADAEASESTGDESETEDEEEASVPDDQAQRYALRDAAMAYHGVTHEELDGNQPGGDKSDGGFRVKDSMVILYCTDHRILKVRKAVLEASQSD